MRTRYLSDVRALASKALAHGGRQLSVLQVLWPMAGDCKSPYTTEVVGASSPPKGGGRHVLKGVHMSVILETRCRSCEACVTARRRLWTLRAQAETRLWPRTWKGTLTLRPDAHYMMLLRASTGKLKRAVKWDELSAAQQFAAIDREVYADIKLYLKRLRANYGPIRFLFVTEAHKSGLHHYHALVHQTRADEPLKYSHLKGAHWPHGFVRWKLCQSVAEASYACKYLSKSAAARVRASQAYGSALGHSEMTIDTCTSNLPEIEEYDHRRATAPADSEERSGSIDTELGTAHDVLDRHAIQWRDIQEP